MRVYVSSTKHDLEAHRKRVIEALEEAGYDCSAMEKYPAFDERPLRFCRDDVARCDVYIGIFAHRYGFRPAGRNDNPLNKSITHLEYDHAGEVKPSKPRLIFLVDPQYAWP